VTSGTFLDVTVAEGCELSMYDSDASNKDVAATGSVAAAIEMHDVTVRFDTLVANDGVSLTIGKREIHAIVGENGAGKTTLMNVLSGLVTPASGTVDVGGRPLKLGSPNESARAGVTMVHQHFKLVPSLTVAENVFLGREPTRGGLISRRRLVEQARLLSEPYGLKVDPRRRVGTLTVGERQRVELLRVLSYRGNIVIFDEPTAVLAPREVDDLFKVLRRLCDEGQTVILITHKLEEVSAIADRCTVMRAGRKVRTLDVRDTPRAQIAHLMVGRELVQRARKGPSTTHDVLLELTDVHALDESGNEVVSDVSFAVRGGEIVGVAGVEGNGQTELSELIVGVRAASAGRIAIGGRDVTDTDVRSRRQLGLAYVAEDRFDRGCCPDMSIADNLAVMHYRRAGLQRRGLHSRQRVARWARKIVEQFDIRGVADVKQGLGSLSGGNMQRVIIARELLQQPRVLVACQPCRGVDIGAMEGIHEQLLAQREQGNAVLLISADLTELLALSDRVLVMYNGQVVGELDGARTSREEVGRFMMGLKAEAVNDE
jgi:general nucleoside transport system ATP-binding protein